MAELYKRLFPVVVQHEVFWMRYFYKSATACLDLLT